MIKKQDNWHSVSDICKQKIANKIEALNEDINNIPSEQKQHWVKLLSLIKTEIKMITGE